MSEKPLDDHADLMRLWGRFIRLNGRIQAAVTAQLRGIGLSIPQFDLMSVLGQNEGASQQDIAERLFVTKGNVSGLVDRLAASGLVERRPTEHDRRSYALHLTEAGRKLLATGMRMHEAYVRDTIGKLSGEDMKTFEHLLMLVRDAVKVEAATAANAARRSA
jgi:DNA-binding MarR family transcriptional regulator